MIEWIFNVLLYGGIGLVIGYTLSNQHHLERADPCVMHHEWRQAPHEQQPEPMMAQAVGGVERWLL